QQSANMMVAIPRARRRIGLVVLLRPRTKAGAMPAQPRPEREPLGRFDAAARILRQSLVKNVVLADPPARDRWPASARAQLNGRFSDGNAFPFLVQIFAPDVPAG